MTGLAVLASAAGGSRLALAAEPAELLGVDIGMPLPELQATVSSTLACRAFGTPTNAIACQGGLGESARLNLESTTYWIVGGRVARIFALMRLPSHTYAQCELAYRDRIARVAALLGLPPSELSAEPHWATPLPDATKLEQLMQGRLAPKASWSLPGRKVTVALHAEQGGPVLVVGLEGSTAAGCAPQQVSALLMALFPPATPAARAAAARGLAACKVEGAAGALAAAAKSSDEKEVQTAAVQALDTMGSTGQAQLEAMARDRKHVEAASLARERLAQNRAAAAEPAALVADVLDEQEAPVAPSRKPEKAKPVAAPPSPAPAAPTPATPAAALAAVPASPAALPTPGQPSAGSPGAASITYEEAAAGEAASPPRLVPAASPPTAPEDETPKGPPDGTALALTTSLVAGGVWGGGLSLLAQQNSPGVLLLVGSAGAVIGGGTAWGLTHFGVRPTPAQALWFANSTAWGTLAGLAAWAGSGSDNVKLKWGLLVGGESLGMGMGVLGARQWQWTPSQILFANSLVLGAGLGGGGGGMLLHPGRPAHISPWVGYGAAPAMVAAAVASRYVDVSTNDLHLLSASALSTAWTGGLLAYGLDTDPATRGERFRGGVLAGLGVGYLGAAALSPFVETSPRRVWLSGAGLLAGNLVGLGSYMMASPDDATRRPLWASVGGLGLGVGTYLAYPRLRFGAEAPAMGLVGAAYGAGTWGLAMAVSNDGSTPRLQGGLLALGTTGALGGLLASGYFHPSAADDGVTLSSAALGATAGIGMAKLASDHTGTGELVGTLTGSAAGFAAGAAFAHYAELRAPDLGAAFLGAGYGGLVGALAPSLLDAEWGEWRRNNQGGLLLGLSTSAMAGAALSHWTGATGATVGVASTGAGLGLGMGIGTGLLWPDNYSQPTRIGAAAGMTAGLAGALLLERPLGLQDGPGDSAAGLSTLGIALGITEGVLLAGLVDPSGLPGSVSAKRQLYGGMLLGGSAGLASGLILSRFVTPGNRELAMTAGGGAFGGFLGRGLAMTIAGHEGRGDTAATMAGVAGGTLALALTERFAPLGNADLAAAATGLGAGAIAGALLPTLGDAEWGGWRRTTEGGLLIGMGGGALAGAAIGHLAHATPGTVAVASTGGLLGLGMGVGTGLLWPNDYSQPTRIGAVAGVSAGMAGALLLARPLHLDEGLGEQAVGLGAVGTGVGIAEGLLLAGLVDPSGEVSNASDRQLRGGALLGGSAGLATGLILSKYFQPSSENLAIASGGGLLGGMFGRGLMMTAFASDGRRDTAGTMAGTLLGTTGFALTEHFAPLGGIDAAAAAAGAAYGGVVGALAPTLGDASWGGWDRGTEGGLLLGLSGGAMGAAALSHAAGLREKTLGLGLAGAVDGAFTGAGIGLLVDRNASSTQGARVGVVAGATGGLLLGLGFWPRLELDANTLAFAGALTAVGGWTGGWAPVLGHAKLADVADRDVAGGIMAGAGGASILASVLVPALHVDLDLIGDALVTDAIFSGAGAGVGRLASSRDDGPVWGMLGAGTAGLVLGGVLHDSIDFGRAGGLLAFGALEGAWAGAWLPYTLHPTGRVTESQNAAGVAAGGFGGLGLALLASTFTDPSGGKLGMSAAGSAMGAAVAGGSVLLADELHDQRGVGIMLGGTAAGLGVGALVSAWAPLDGRRSAYMLGGAGFGLAEGLAFAWAGRASTGSEYGGSALVGAGIGSALGLASSADAIGLNTQQGLVASGFSAWGGWVGSFSGALANRDPHEVMLGGLAAANVGFLAGYGALRYDLVEARDFGWLSLGGALGTALGGGIGAALSTSSDPRPVLAGLAVGPVVGIGTAALVVPRLRHRAEPSSASLRPTSVAGIRFDLSSSSDSTRQRNSADVLAERKPSRLLAGLKLAQRSLFDVVNWTPVFGSLPPPPGDPNPAPLFLGISGGLR